ncbi:hypothetical protein [Rhizobium chutanense]|uniref:Uncharacterized protein n=1 Tax=Rhizobium chutanense TaxID=2035448 RepID=A0A3S0QNS0_9HYPH|nr:hypothetical protein [Rhizobium chutanense]RUM00211.1 hypothetical protein EFR84_25455 [Rhizobium chutanense]
MLSSAHTPRQGDDRAAEWLSLAAASDGSADKPPSSVTSAVGRRAAQAADWLAFAAAPTFTLMALLTAATGSAAVTCMTTADAFPIAGMAPMYLLMAGFHLAPWLRLAGRRPT